MSPLSHHDVEFETKLLDLGSPTLTENNTSLLTCGDEKVRTKSLDLGSLTLVGNPSSPLTHRDTKFRTKSLDPHEKPYQSLDSLRSQSWDQVPRFGFPKPHQKPL